MANNIYIPCNFQDCINAVGFLEIDISMTIQSLLMSKALCSLFLSWAEKDR